MDMKAMMKQAQKMQRDAAAMQEEINQMGFTSSSGGGMVEATVLGSGQVKSLKISPEVVDPGDVELLQDMIVAAINDASEMASDKANSMMNSVMGGVNIPGLM